MSNELGLFMQFDESTDIVDLNTPMSFFMRMVFSDFMIKEEILKVIPLKSHTTKHLKE